MATSSVPTLKSNLKTRLAARAGLAGVQISYGAPFPNPGREFIALGDVQGEQAAAALGRQRREEDYDLTIYVRVLRQGVDQQAATERAYALAAEIENDLRNDATVNGAVRVAQVAGPFSLEEGATEDGKGRAALLVLTVHCDHRI